MANLLSLPRQSMWEDTKRRGLALLLLTTYTTETAAVNTNHSKDGACGREDDPLPKKL
jgi:hypothetical protein